MRVEIGWTQAQLARILNITRSSLAHYEQGRASAPFIVVRKIAILHTTITAAIDRVQQLG